MSATLSDGVTTVTPLLATQWNSQRTVRHVEHEIVGSAAVAFTARPAGPRKGTIGLLFATHGDALEAEAMLSGTSLITFTESDQPTLDMSFMVNGYIDTELDDETRDRWTIRFNFTEVV